MGKGTMNKKIEELDFLLKNIRALEKMDFDKSKDVLIVKMHRAVPNHAVERILRDLKKMLGRDAKVLAFPEGMMDLEIVSQEEVEEVKQPKTIDTGEGKEVVEEKESSEDFLNRLKQDTVNEEGYHGKVL